MKLSTKKTGRNIAYTMVLMACVQLLLRFHFAPVTFIPLAALIYLMATDLSYKEYLKRSSDDKI